MSIFIVCVDMVARLPERRSERDAFQVNGPRGLIAAEQGYPAESAIRKFGGMRSTLRGYRTNQTNIEDAESAWRDMRISRSGPTLAYTTE